jgi:hypothetical protein
MDEDDPTPAESYIDAMTELYFQHYLVERREILRTETLIHLILLDQFPDVFRSYLRIEPHSRYTSICC